MKRRRFLMSVGGGLAAAAGGSWMLARAGRSSNDSPSASAQFPAYSRTARALGTDVSITVHHPDAGQARQALDAAFGELALVESLMSIYRDASPLSQLNRHGVLDDPHPYLVQVLQAAREMAQRSDGAFDITVQPLWALYRQAQRSGRLPAAAEIQRAREQVDWRCVVISRDRIELRRPATAVTLNGIAQGFAADKVKEVLSKHGIQHALIDTGEVGTVGGNPHGRPWNVGIQHPRQADAFISLAALQGRCLATSGDYATTFSDDFQHHHLFDPRTGRSPDELASVSITAPSALLADALSTAVYVLGPRRGAILLENTPDADALLVLKNGRTLSTAGFPGNV